MPFLWVNYCAQQNLDQHWSAYLVMANDSASKESEREYGWEEEEEVRNSNIYLTLNFAEFGKSENNEFTKEERIWTKIPSPIGECQRNEFLMAQIRYGHNEWFCNQPFLAIRITVWRSKRKSQFYDCVCETFRSRKDVTHSYVSVWDDTFFEELCTIKAKLNHRRLLYTIISYDCADITPEGLAFTRRLEYENISRGVYTKQCLLFDKLKKKLHNDVRTLHAIVFFRFGNVRFVGWTNLFKTCCCCPKLTFHAFFWTCLPLLR